jgi:Na+/H+-dicarboxylate symporter
MSKSKKKIGLTNKILMALIFGVLIGVLINTLIAHNQGSNLAIFLQETVVKGVFHVAGKIFLNSIKMVVVPLVMVSLICGITGIGDINKLGRVGGKTIFYYLFSTSIAVVLALGVAKVINPGMGLNLAVEGKQVALGDAPPLTQVLIDLVPDSFFAALNGTNMIQVIVLALLVGIALTSVADKAKKLLVIMNEMNEVVMKMIGIVIDFAPYGVFALITKVFAEQGFSVFIPLLKYMFTVIFALFLHYIFVFLLSLKVMSGLSPITFLRKFTAPMIVAFSTSSSKASIPVLLECMEHKMGVSKNIASFTIPVGASMNMNGTAIMQGIAVLFISQIYNIPLSPSDYAVVILMATMAAVGAAGVPGVGLITLSMVLTQVHLPVEGIAIIMGVDRVIDMCRTVVNITGDAIVTLIVAKSENELDEKVYNSLANID